MLYIDFETYSEAGYCYNRKTKKVTGTGSQGKGGLPATGTPVYAEHPSTDIICLSYQLGDGPTKRWTPMHPAPVELLEHVALGRPVSGWNITFEFYIWNMVCVRRFGWPALRIEQCYCSMAKSRRFSLPGGLGACAKVLGSDQQKDKEGTRLIQKLCRPHTPTKARDGVRWTADLAWDDYLAMFEYCDQDVRTEASLAKCIPDLTEYERSTWLVDQTINVRGVQVDVRSLDDCLEILRQAESKYTHELQVLSEGAVRSVNENVNFLAWLQKEGVNAPNMQKETVDSLLKSENLPPVARRALEIRQTLGLANVKKLHILKRQVSRDGRLRDQYMYCGADRTGRASAGGVQLQNITGRGPASYTCDDCGTLFGPVDACPTCGNSVGIEPRGEWDIDAVEQALRDIQKKDLANVERTWGSRPVELLCGVLRGLFVARSGHRFICCDFSAIEAVVLACLSRCQWRVDVFNTHGEIYLMSAAKITGKSIEEYRAFKKKTGSHHADRKIGKIAELSCGYSGWVGAWRNFDKSDRSDAEIKEIILKWRADSPEIVDFWGGQYRWCGPGKWDYRYELFGLEGAAIMAIKNPGQRYHVHDISYVVANDVLYCTLPSGRNLHYHRPRLVPAEDRLKRGPLEQIVFEGWNSNPQKGPKGWIVMETYGGRLAENCTQAVAADIQFDAIKRLEASGYPVVMHTHDEAIAERLKGEGSWQEMAAIMSQRPTWANWWPIKADGWEHKRYRKD
jgi:DNA polymerase